MLSAGVANAETNVAQLTTGDFTSLQALHPTTAQNLQNALTTGRLGGVANLLVNAHGNTALTQAVAAVVFAAAKSLNATDPSGAAYSAAIAYASGGLKGADGISAQNLVNASGNTDASDIVSQAQESGPMALVDAQRYLAGLTISSVKMAQNGGRS